MAESSRTFVSDLSRKEYPIQDKVSGRSVRQPLLRLIQEDHPGFSEDQSLSMVELNYYREKYISTFLVNEIGEWRELQESVLDSLRDQTTLTPKVSSEDSMPITFGQRVADRVASFGGSWTFILSFGGFLAVWILTNALLLRGEAFDPYPFILLNLLLSCLAALQAPVIMMSQNRQEEKDRERAKSDYMINLKSELEIRMLHEKLDHLIMRQQQELIDIQKVQIDMMNDILSRVDAPRHAK